MNSIAHDNPHSTTYDRYGDPYRLAEFRMFVLNGCEMSCKGCFYDRDNNHFDDFKSAYTLAQELSANDHVLETCYLLPTDVFENIANYELFNDPWFRDTVSQFNFVGIASTLEKGYDPHFFDLVFDVAPHLGVELQVNLVLKRLFDIDYGELIEKTIVELKQRYGERIVINLAINVGFEFKESEMLMLNRMFNRLSEDAIVEVNFTFLYNEQIPYKNRRKMMRNSIATINELTEHYRQDSSFHKQLNDRTFLRKPSFSFLGSPNRIYVTPILPFDEYVFIDDEAFVLKEPSYGAFLEVFTQTSSNNDVVDDRCYSCPQLQHCLGKHYFTIAHHYGLGCYKEIV